MDSKIVSDCRRGRTQGRQRAHKFTMHCVTKLSVLLAMLFGLSGCVEFPDPPEDDEGHASFAREATVVLLGRRARGVDEVEALADISQLLGRDVAIEMLMKDEAFIDHWTATIIDIIEMQRDGQGGAAAQDDDCWGPPTRDVPDPAIAEWVRDNGPTDAGAPTPEWNMTDLLRSAIALDDLSVVYRANLFTLSMRRAGGDKRTVIADRFLKTYLNRDVTCLRCHNPTFSASNKTDADGNIVWRRLWTILGHAEKALFGDYYDAALVLDRLYPIMQPDVRQPVPGAGIQPWGISQECASDTTSVSPRNNGVETHAGFKTIDLEENDTAGFGSLDGLVTPTVALWELEDSLRTGILDLQDGYERFEAVTPLLPPDEQLFCDAVVQLIATHNCGGCHPPSGDLDLLAEDLSVELINVDTDPAGSSIQAKRVVPGLGNASISELWQRISSADPVYQMPPGGGVTQPEWDLVEDWIDASAPTTSTENCNTSDIPDVYPDEAFAFLTASNFVDGIWTSVMGYPLTIDHGYPRNRDQRDMLWNLTENTFLPGDWSLKAVLKKMLSSNWMARRAPTISQQGTAYELHPIVDPWIVADPTEPDTPTADQVRNGQGELVDRGRVNTLLRTVASTLGWEDPRPFPDGNYPSPLDENLGQYLSPDVPGFNGISFQSLLALEAEAGLCVKSGRAVGADDWIDKLIADINAHNSDNPDAPITVSEAWAMLKDRLIQDPTIETALPSGLNSEPDAKTEEQALIAFLNEGLVIAGGLTANSATNVLTDDQLDDKLRQACGVLVKSPQFMLTNLTPRGFSDNAMPLSERLTVCLDGEPCGYTATCLNWSGVLFGMGHTIACEDRSVRNSDRLFPDLDFDIIDIIDPGPFTPGLPRNRIASGGPRQIAAQNAKIDPSSPTVRKDPQSRSDLQAVRRRTAALCPKGLCGFVKRPRVEQCRKNPSRETCLRLLPPCDPRRADAVNFCGNQPADVHDTGVLVTWADGAVVNKSRSVRRLQAGKWKWTRLKPNTRLSAGDLLDVPLNATLVLQADKLRFGQRGMDVKQVDGIRGHLIAVTGQSAERFLSLPPKEGAMSAAELQEGLESERFESRAVTRKDWQRILGYGKRAISQTSPTLEEIKEINADFDALHSPEDLEFTRPGKQTDRR